MDIEPTGADLVFIVAALLCFIFALAKGWPATVTVLLAAGGICLSVALLFAFS